MRILAFVDLHENKEALKKIIERAKKKDISLVVCAGDFTIFSNSQKKILKELNTIGKPILIIHGNHEEATELRNDIKNYQNIKFLHGNWVRTKEHIFIGWGGGGFSYKDEKLEKNMEKLGKVLKKEEKIIFVTHAPPHKTKLDKIHNEHAGNKTIRKFIEKYKPILAISGHLHENAGKIDKIEKTLIVNPGHKGKVFEI